MVLVGGLERMTFEVLRALRKQGAVVHCIVNWWDNSHIIRMAEKLGASWSTGFYNYKFTRHTRNPRLLAQFAWDTMCTSAGLLRDAWRFRATHVFVSDYITVLAQDGGTAITRIGGNGDLVRERISLKSRPGTHITFVVDDLVPGISHREEIISQFGSHLADAIGQRTISLERRVFYLQKSQVRGWIQVKDACFERGTLAILDFYAGGIFNHMVIGNEISFSIYQEAGTTGFKIGGGLVGRAFDPVLVHSHISPDWGYGETLVG